MAPRFVIIGGGPAGNTAATHAARLGAEVTLVERDVVGGAAHLWDCIPSKAMIATGGAMSFQRRIGGMGLHDGDPELDFQLIRHRISEITGKLQHNVSQLLASQGVRIINGSGRLKGPHEVVAETAAGVAVWTAIFRYYRNTDKRNDYEHEVGIVAQPVTGSDQKVDEVRGTRRKRIEGDNVANYRQRVQRIPSDPEPQ